MRESDIHVGEDIIVGTPSIFVEHKSTGADATTILNGIELRLIAVLNELKKEKQDPALLPALLKELQAFKEYVLSAPVMDYAPALDSIQNQLSDLALVLGNILSATRASQQLLQVMPKEERLSHALATAASTNQQEIAVLKSNLEGGLSEVRKILINLGTLIDQTSTSSAGEQKLHFSQVKGILQDIHSGQDAVIEQLKLLFSAHDEQIRLHHEHMNLLHGHIDMNRNVLESSEKTNVLLAKLIEEVIPWYKKPFRWLWRKIWDGNH